MLSAVGVPYRFVDPGLPSPDIQRYVDLVDRGTRDAGERTAGTVVLPKAPKPLTGGSDEPDGAGSSELAPLFAALSRQEEYAVSDRDRYERFLWSHTTVRPREAAVRPLVSEYAVSLLGALREGATRAGAPFIRIEPWPRGRPMAACLTHDVDVVRRGKLPRGVAVRDVRRALASAAKGRLKEASARVATIGHTVASSADPYWMFDHIAALERKHGFRSTYFVMAGRLHPEDASYDPAQPRMRRLISSLAESGCEIGLHGSFGPFADSAALSAQKERLEALVDRPITGHRNHLLRFAVPGSWRAQAKAGFSYDATLGFADHEGYRGCHAFPFHPYDLPADHPLDLMEMPLAAMDVTIHKYRGLRGSDALSAVESVLQQTLSTGGLATLLWHNDTFYDEDYPGCGKLYEAALAWLATHEAWVAPCDEVDRWWQAREVVQIDPLPAPRSGWSVEVGAEIDGLMLEVALPDPTKSPRVRGVSVASTSHDGRDWRLGFDRLPAGSRFAVEL